MSFEEWNEATPIDNTETMYKLRKFALLRNNAYQKYLAEPENKSLKWEEIIKQNLRTSNCFIGSISQIKESNQDMTVLTAKHMRNTLPTKEIAEQELARMQWIMIAYEANNGWIREPNGIGVYVSNLVNKVGFNTTNVQDERTLFKTKELCQQAYEENKEIVHTMLGIKI